MKTFKVTVGCDYFQGHLRYGHGEAIIEAEDIEQVKEKAKNYDFTPIVDDYELEDHDSWNFNDMEIEEIGGDLVKYENNELVVSNSVIDLLKDFKKKKVEIELQEKQLREELLEAMEKYGIQNWKSNDETITAIYKKGYQRTSIDSARLKKELPDVAEEYSKTTQVKPSVELAIEL